MAPALGRTVTLAALLGLGSVGLSAYYAPWRRAPAAGQPGGPDPLASVAERLSAGPRVAKVLVLHQGRDGKGAVSTSCLFIEYAVDGKTMLPARHVGAPAAEMRVEVKTIEFDAGAAARGLVGKRVTLFTRAIDGNGSPVDGGALETPGEVPDFYRDEGRIAPEELKFWANVWHAADDPAFARTMGATASREVVRVPLAPNVLSSIWAARGGVGVAAEVLSAQGREMINRSAGP